MLPSQRSFTAISFSLRTDSHLRSWKVAVHLTTNRAAPLALSPPLSDQGRRTMPSNAIVRCETPPCSPEEAVANAFKMSTLSIVLMSFVTIAEAFHQEMPRPRSPMNLVREAESFALEHRVKPTELLILDLFAVLTTDSIMPSASLLVLRGPTPVHKRNRKSPHKSRRSPKAASRVSLEERSDLSPTFLDVLAVNLRVVVISRPLGELIEPFQNFRHKCLLHMILGIFVNIENIVHLSTLFWYGDNSRYFQCVQRYDHMISWRTRPVRRPKKSAR